MKLTKVFGSEQNFQIVMETMRAELSVFEICRKYSISDTQFYKWNKEFMEAGKKRLAGDTVREASSDEVSDLRSENRDLKELVATLLLQNNHLKKSIAALG